jgi:hypothetical protein
MKNAPQRDQMANNRIAPGNVSLPRKAPRMRFAYPGYVALGTICKRDLSARTALGGWPIIRLNARLNDASES